MGRLLNAHFETARHHQDIRDRWHRFYTLVVGAIFSVTGAFITTLITTGKGAVFLPSNISDEDIYREVIPAIVDVSAILVFVFGVLSLGLYLTQVVNYFIDYYYIDRILESFTALHSEVVERRSMLNPFIFTYSYVDDILKDSLCTFVWRKFWWSPASWSADFFANSFTIFINSVCGTIVVVGMIWPSSRWTLSLGAFGFFTSFCILQIAVRQTALGFAIYKALRQVSGLKPPN